MTVVFVIQRAPGHVPPDWPEGTSQQMHVDLTTDDLVAVDRSALEAGAEEGAAGVMPNR